MICEFTEPFPYYTQYTGIGENRVRDTLSSLKKSKRLENAIGLRPFLAIKESM